MNVTLWFLLALVAGFSCIGIVVAAVSRHQKAASGEIALIGKSGRVDTTLAPEGAVLVQGELWRARLRSGSSLEPNTLVRVVGVQAHLLLVEAATIRQ